MDTDEERIALFLDYENLAIGARDNLGASVRPPPGARRARRAGPGGRAEGLRGLVVLRRGPPDADARPRRADRDPAADGRLAQERRRHQDGGRRHRDGVRARLHHDLRDLHRRQRLHPARPQAARAEQARDRRGHQGLDLGAAAARLRRVPLLRRARGRRAVPAGRRRRRRGRVEAAVSSRPRPRRRRRRARGRGGAALPSRAPRDVDQLAMLGRPDRGRARGHLRADRSSPRR